MKLYKLFFLFPCLLLTQIAFSQTQRRASLEISGGLKFYNYPVFDMEGRQIGSGFFNSGPIMMGMALQNKSGNLHKMNLGGIDVWGSGLFKGDKSLWRGKMQVSYEYDYSIRKDKFSGVQPYVGLKISAGGEVYKDVATYFTGPIQHGATGRVSTFFVPGVRIPAGKGIYFDVGMPIELGGLDGWSIKFKDDPCGPVVGQAKGLAGFGSFNPEIRVGIGVMLNKK